MNDINTLAFPYWLEPAYDRLASLRDDSKLGHAYLLEGQQGLGKSLFASRLAAFLLCVEPDSLRACGKCRTCALRIAGSHPDYKYLGVEEGAQTIKIDQVRDAIDFIGLTPSMGRHKVVIIEPAETMTRSAANALLKSLEEPSPGTLLILICHRPGLLMPTTRSRCQVIKFGRPDEEQVLKWLSVAAPDLPVNSLLKLANGAPLRALQLAEGNLLRERQALHEVLLKLLDGEISAVEAAATRAGSDLAENIEGLLLGLGELLAHLHRRVDGNSSTPSEADDEPSTRSLTEIAARIQARRESTTHNGYLKALHLYYREILQARRAIMLSNPNPALLLESLFYKWARLSAQHETGDGSTTRG